MCPARHDHRSVSASASGSSSTSGPAPAVPTSGVARQGRDKHQQRQRHHRHHHHNTTTKQAHTGQSRDRESHDELLEFVRRRREDKERALEELARDAQDGTTTDERFRIRPPTPEAHPEAPSLAEVRAKAERLLREGAGPCAVCHRDSGPHLGDGFPCRVCGHAFHRQCLVRVAQLTEDELDEQLKRAHTNIGWSCPTCDDISTLLTEKELNDMMEDFDNFDINKEAGITIDDYMAIKKQEYETMEGHVIGELDLLRMKAQFQCMDINGDGMIAWWEFVKEETCKKLAKRSKDSMVSLLTDVEVSTAHQLFCIFDDDNDGQISEFAIRKAYRSWYSRLTANTNRTPARPTRSVSSLVRAGDTLDDIDDPVLDLHVEQHCRIVLGESEDNKCGVLSWEDFILEQSLYIICSRPNRAIAGHTTHL